MFKHIIQFEDMLLAIKIEKQKIHKIKNKKKKKKKKNVGIKECQWGIMFALIAISFYER